MRQHDEAGDVARSRAGGRRDRERAGHRDGGRDGDRAASLLHDRGHRPVAGASAGVREGDVLRRGRGRREPPERETGRRGEDQRHVGAGEVDQPAALARRRHLGAARRLDRVARLLERRLDLRDRPGRVALLEQRGRAGDVRRRHARAAQVAERSLVRGQRREDADARARTTSGFIWSDIGVGPADEKSAITLRESTAATVIALGRVARRRHGAVAEVGEVVPGRDHGHDACGGRAVDRRHDEVARRLDLRLAERQVDHVHPVGRPPLRSRRRSPRCCRRARSRASGSSAPCSCRGTRSARRRRSACRRRSCRGRLPRCRRRASRGRTRSGRTGVFAYFQVGDGGANVRCTITFGVVYCVWPFGKPGGVLEAARVEVRVRRVEAVVDDADLHPVAGGREGRAPELVGADLLRAADDARCVVADVRPHLGDPGDPGQLADLRPGERRLRSRSRRAGSASGSARPAPRRSRGERARSAQRRPGAGSRRARRTGASGRTRRAPAPSASRRPRPDGRRRARQPVPGKHNGGCRRRQDRNHKSQECG